MSENESLMSPLKNRNTHCFSINNRCLKKNTKRNIIIIGNSIHKINQEKKIIHNNYIDTSLNNSEKEKNKTILSMHNYYEKKKNNITKKNFETISSDRTAINKRIRMKNENNMNDNIPKNLKNNEKVINKKINKNIGQTIEKERLMNSNYFSPNYKRQKNIYPLNNCNCICICNYNYNNSNQIQDNYNGNYNNNNYIDYVERIKCDKENINSNLNNVNLYCKDEDITDYINVYDTIHTQKNLFSYDKAKIINEPIEEVEEENEKSETISLSNDNIMKSENNNIDTLNKINEGNDNLMTKYKTESVIKSRIKKRTSFSRFINIKDRSRNEGSIEINKIKINKSEHSNILEKTDKSIKKEISNSNLEKRKNKSFNSSALFRENNDLGNISLKNSIIIRINNIKNRNIGNNYINYNTKTNSQKTYNNIKVNKTNLKHVKVKNKFNKYYKLNTITLNNSAKNKNKICLSLICKNNKSFDNSSIKNYKMKRTNKNNFKSLNLSNTNHEEIYNSITNSNIKSCNNFKSPINSRNNFFDISYNGLYGITYNKRKSVFRKQ